MSNAALNPRTNTDNLRRIRIEDNAAIAAIIRSVLSDFGCNRPGFANQDPEVDAMYETYSNSGSAYFVVEHEGRVVGGGGVAPLKGADAGVCELQKWYLLPAYRGHGYGAQLFNASMQAATSFGYKKCYLETLESMTTARNFYERGGFVQLEKPMGNTGHHGCDYWYIKDLTHG